MSGGPGYLEGGARRRRRGGRRRRRRGSALRLLLGALVVAAAAVAAFLVFGGNGGGTKAPTAPVSTLPAVTRRAKAQHKSTYGLEPEPPASRVSVVFKHPPRSALLFDVKTGRVLWAHDPTRKLPIASLTKMMTAILVVRHEKPSARVKVTKQALAYQGSGMGILPKGKKIRLETMLYGLLLPSGNDAAIALAQRVAGTVPRFVREMNREARHLGLRCSRFASPSGFTDKGNYSCAPDLALLARDMLTDPRLAKIVRSPSAILKFPIKGGKVYLYNNNPLLRQGFPGTDGVKTGFTDAAGRCLVASARRGGHQLAVVLLNSPNPPVQAEQLLDRGFRVMG